MYKAAWKDSFILQKQLIHHLVLCLKALHGDSEFIQAKQVNSSFYDVTSLKGSVVQGVGEKAERWCVRNSQGVRFKGQKNPVVGRKQPAKPAMGE